MPVNEAIDEAVDAAVFKLGPLIDEAAASA
jgi:hypothetical protein